MKLIFHSSTIAMMHGPINIGLIIIWKKGRGQVVRKRTQQRTTGREIRLGNECCV